MEPTSSSSSSLYDDFCRLFEMIDQEQGVLRPTEHVVSDSAPSSSASVPHTCDEAERLQKKDNPLKSEYMGTDGDGCSYKGYVRPPRSQRVRPIKISQDHIIIDTTGWHFLNNTAGVGDLHLNEGMAVLSAAAALADMVARSMPPPPGCTIEPCDDNGNIIRTNQCHPQRGTYQQQQQETPYKIARSPDAIECTKEACPVCHGYLPFGPQCFPCVIMSDEPGHDDENDADDKEEEHDDDDEKKADDD